MDFEWLQHVGNPYTVIAVIAAIVGTSFRVLLKNNAKAKPAFTLISYAMFLIAILALVLSVVAVNFILAGVGATDRFTGSLLPREGSFIARAYAQEDEKENQGWLWIGTIGQERDGGPLLESETTNADHWPDREQIVITTDNAYLRDKPPWFSWWGFRYRLGGLLTTIPKGQELEILEHRKVGRQLWCRVEMVE